MNLNSIANQINTAYLSGDELGNVTMSSDAKISLIEQRLMNGVDVLNALGIGSTISGKVIMSEGDMILLSLGSDKLLQAKVSSDIIPQEGQLMTFLVNNNSERTISLSPLFVNTHPDSNVTVALKNADLPDNPQMQYMVKTMMEEGLPISKEALHLMNKNINEFPQTDPKILSQMTRLDIPVNENMIEQFKNYLNYEHHITASVMDIADSFSLSIMELYDADRSFELLDFTKETLSSLLPENIDNTEIVSDNPNESVNNESNINEFRKVIEDFLENSDSAQEEKQVLSLLKDNRVNVKDVLNVIVNQIDLNNNEPDKTEALAKVVKELFGDEKVKNFVKESMENKFLLKPEEVAHKDNISSLYDKLNSQMKSLTSALSYETDLKLPLSQTVSNINNNINFMNELNQTFNYIQIPLKLSNKETSGELYVYTNKKSLAHNDGNVSALLHLDMDNIGPLDVHVMMNPQKHVSTKFYLKDDEALDLIAANIDKLNKRLEDRGYSMTSEFINKGEDKPVFESMIDESKNISVISSGSFDAKA